MFKRTGPILTDRGVWSIGIASEPRMTIANSFYEPANDDWVALEKRHKVYEEQELRDRKVGEALRESQPELYARLIAERMN